MRLECEGDLRLTVSFKEWEQLRENDRLTVYLPADAISFLI